MSANHSEHLPLCLIPARGGSKRVPRKNVAMLGGKPLIAWTIAAARESQLFAGLYVSSEDQEILETAARYGAHPLARPEHLAGDSATLLDVCMEILPGLAEQTGATDLYLLTPTAPLRSAQTMRTAWQCYLEGGGSSLVSVEPYDYPPQWALTQCEGRLKPLFPHLFETPRPALAPALKHDGGHIITGIARVLAERDFWGADARPFWAPESERLDIDVQEDLDRARAIVADLCT